MLFIRCYQSIGIVWETAVNDECRFGHHLRLRARATRQKQDK